MPRRTATSRLAERRVCERFIAERRVGRHVVAVLVLCTFILGACSGGKGGGGGGGSDTAGLKVSSPLQVSYRHVSDSGGAPSPYGDAAARLLFEPGDAVSLYIANQESGLGRHGTYHYDGKAMTLRLGSDELTVDTRFDLDLNKDTVQLPFQLFSDDKGSSKWQREVVGVMSGTDRVFQAARYDDVAKIQRDDAVKRAQAYAAARVELDGGAFGDGEHSLPAGRGNGSSGAGGSGEVQLVAFRQQSVAPPRIVGTEPFANGVTLVYDDGSRADVLLFSWKPQNAGDVVNLRPAPFANDPRVELPTKSPGDASADPSNKEALLINPFAKEFDEAGDVASASKTLQSRGYTVKTLLDADATFENIVDSLTGGVGGGEAPGFVTLSTHGGASGAMATSEVLGVPDSPKAEAEIHDKMRKVAERIDKVFPGAREFKVGGQKRQPFQPLLYSHGPNDQRVYVGLSPTFWAWLRSGVGTSFADSFVFLSACDSDKNPEIRNSLGAKVFVGFSEQANVTAAKKAFSYLVEQLARPTRSAEEANYNLVRVLNTEQMIYKEDKLFDGTPSKPLAEILEFYSGGTGSPKPYEGHGWLDKTNLDLGQVWWLVYSGRWSGDAAEGAVKLQNCWDQFWSAGNKGGLASPACNASNTGTVPKAQEVSYAIYLLTGHEAMVSLADKVPRWTLADGR